MTVFPRQKIYGFSLLRQLKIFFSQKKINSKNLIKKYFELSEDYHINFVFKARVGLFHILKFLIKNDKSKNKILLSSFTVFDMINMILLSGFEPIFVDHYKNSSQIDIKQLKKIVEKYDHEIGAVLLTHFNVNNSDLQEISRICNMNKITLIEDCAISIGSKLDKDYVGKFGDFSIFSFGFYKFINVLSGGMVLSKNKDFHDYIIEEEKNWKEVRFYNLYKLIIKNFLIKFFCSKVVFNLIFPIIKFSYKYDIKSITKYLINDPKPHKKSFFPKEYKFRLSELQINDIIYQLENLEFQRKLREKNYFNFSKNIKNKEVIFFHNEKDLFNKNAYLNFPILVKDKKKFINYMLDNGIDLSPQFYRSVNKLPIFCEHPYATQELQNSVSKLVTLPTYSGISDKYILKVINIINKY
jgi:dTDP-4-amino-4,6-dideoxygalactose transaminase